MAKGFLRPTRARARRRSTGRRQTTVAYMYFHTLEHQTMANAPPPTIPAPAESRDHLSTPLRTADASFDFNRWASDKLAGVPPPSLHVAERGSRLNRLGIGPGQIVVIGGTPGSGKTALVQQLAFDALRLPNQDELKVAICNVEMSPDSLMDRELARLSGVPYSTIAEGPRPPEHDNRIRVGIAAIRAYMPRVQFVPGPFTIPQIMPLVGELDPDIVVIDYLQRLRGATSDARVQVSEAMEGLREMANQGRAVIAVAAVNRTSYGVHKGSAADFRDSSEVEYGADAAYLLQRELNSTSATLQCVKRRHGAPEDVALQFNGNRQLFTEVDEVRDGERT